MNNVRTLLQLASFWNLQVGKASEYVEKTLSKTVLIFILCFLYNFGDMQMLSHLLTPMLLLKVLWGCQDRGMKLEVQQERALCFVYGKLEKLLVMST